MVAYGLSGMLLTVALIGCYPNDDLTLSELDIVATNYDDDYFSRKSPSIYLMPDTVVQIGDGDPNDPQLNRRQMDFILDQVERNFSALGYDRIDEATLGRQPDVVVTVSVLVTRVTGGDCIPWYPWWGWYPWYPGWGWGAGYCYPVYIYSYDTGTLVIDMITPEETVDDTFKRVWNAGINGLVRSSVDGNQAFVTQTIDKAFEQSPYLD